MKAFGWKFLVIAGCTFQASGATAQSVCNYNNPASPSYCTTADVSEQKARFRSLNDTFTANASSEANRQWRGTLFDQMRARLSDCSSQPANATGCQFEVYRSFADKLEERLRRSNEATSNLAASAPLPSPSSDTTAVSDAAAEAQSAALENETAAELVRQQRVNTESAELKEEETAERKQEVLWKERETARRFKKYSSTLTYIYFPFWMAVFTFFIWRSSRLHRETSSTKFVNKNLSDFEKGLDKNQKAILVNFAIPQAEGLRQGEFRSHVIYPGLACLVSLLGAYIGSRDLVGTGPSSYIAIVIFWVIVGYSIFTVIFSYLKYIQIEGPLLIEKLDMIAGSYGCSKCKSDFSVYERKVGEDILYAVPQQRTVTKKGSSGSFYTTHENWTDVRVKEHMSRDCIKCGAKKSWKQESVRRENYSTYRSN